MPAETKRRPLKIEPDRDADNLLEQLVASMLRIERGLDGVRELVLAIDRGVMEVTRGRD
jgi:hypothetical protein